jgi:hypothetical protein
MNNMKQLRSELHQVGADNTEVEMLLPIASSLGRLKRGHAQSRAKRRGAQLWPQFMKLAASGTLVLALGMFVIISSQIASPNSWLYPLQKVSDSVAISLHPQYRATIMMKRAQQVNQLVADHADSKLVLSTLADYTSEASAYKATPHANYAAFEFCRDNLQRAAAGAPPDIRRAITSSLQAIETS